jgi:hypothetical protein
VNVGNTTQESQLIASTGCVYGPHLVFTLPKLDLVANNDVMVFALLPILELEHDETLFHLGVLRLSGA